MPSFLPLLLLQKQFACYHTNLLSVSPVFFQTFCTMEFESGVCLIHSLFSCTFNLSCGLYIYDSNLISALLIHRSEEPCFHCLHLAFSDDTSIVTVNQCWGSCDFVHFKFVSFRVRLKVPVYCSTNTAKSINVSLAMPKVNLARKFRSRGI